LAESNTDKTFTQHEHDKYSLQTKTQKPADRYFRKARETPGEFVALVIVLRYLLVNAHALYRDNGPLTVSVIWMGNQLVASEKRK